MVFSFLLLLLSKIKPFTEPKFKVWESVVCYRYWLFEEWIIKNINHYYWFYFYEVHFWSNSAWWYSINRIIHSKNIQHKNNLPPKQ